MSAKKPVHKIHVGYVSATIWANENNGQTYHAVEVQRSYKNADGNIGNTSSLSYGDVPNAIRALERARDWIEAQQS